MQIFSNAGQDEPEKIQKDAAEFIPENEVPRMSLPNSVCKSGRQKDWQCAESPEQYFKYNFGYDIVSDCKQWMKKEDPSWELPDTFFEKVPGKGIYP